MKFYSNSWREGRGLGCLCFVWVLYVSVVEGSTWQGQPVRRVMSMTCLCLHGCVSLGYVLSFATGMCAQVESARRKQQPHASVWAESLGPQTAGREWSWSGEPGRGGNALHLTYSLLYGKKKLDIGKGQSSSEGVYSLPDRLLPGLPGLALWQSLLYANFSLCSGYWVRQLKERFTSPSKLSKNNDHVPMGTRTDIMTICFLGYIRRIGDLCVLPFAVMTFMSASKEVKHSLTFSG